MDLSYRLIGQGYVIMNNGVDWIIQDVYIPYPKGTVEESAQAHIDAIIADNEATEQEQTTIEQLQQQIADLQDALIELASAVEGGSV